MIGRTERDVTTCQQLQIDVIDFDPRGRRRSSFVIESLRKAADYIGNIRAAQSKQENSANKSLALADYRWPGANAQFSKIVSARQPSLVLFDYVIWADLLREFPKHARPFQAIVNTHDLLFQRNLQFSDRQQDHWINISKDEEADALRKFDLIISIQSEETAIMKKMSPKSDVVEVGHCCFISECNTRPTSKPLSGDNTNQSFSRNAQIGFIGSKNAANVDGIVWFLQSCWPQIRESSSAELVIAGSVCEAPELVDQLVHCRDTQSVRLLGLIEHLSKFYERIDFSINPVRFGSGLKIKMIESLHFGKPMVVHRHCSSGVSHSILAAVDVAGDEDEFVQRCLQLTIDPAYRRRQASSVKQVADKELSPERVFAQLSQWLDSRFN